MNFEIILSSTIVEHGIEDGMDIIHYGEHGNMYIKSKYDLSAYCNYMTL